MTRGQPTVWLDITRLTSRVGRGPFTGIDRVEFAYLEGLLERDVALFGLARTATGYVLLDRRGCLAFLDRIAGRVPWGPPDSMSRLCLRLAEPRRRAESDLRRLAVDRCLRPQLGNLLRRMLSPGTPVLNVGHSNLSEKTLGALASRGARLGIMVHDTIPLDFPHLHRPGMPASFATRMKAVARHAERIVFPTVASARRFGDHFGPARRALIAQPGVVQPLPDVAALHARLVPKVPCFVAVGTIDGRKNQGFLVDLWKELGPEPPALYLAGSRGWCPGHLASRLDALPAGVTEIAGLPDGALAALVDGSAALLHPSLAEGYGFPLLEAALLGVPVVAADLPVYADTVGDIGVYLPHDDLYQWSMVVENLTRTFARGEQKRAKRPDRPTWDAHLNLVLSTF